MIFLLLVMYCFKSCYLFIISGINNNDEMRARTERTFKQQGTWAEERKQKHRVRGKLARRVAKSN